VLASQGDYGGQGASHARPDQAGPNSHGHSAGRSNSLDRVNQSGPSKGPRTEGGRGQGAGSGFNQAAADQAAQVKNYLIRPGLTAMVTQPVGLTAWTG
jgi:hypothetical protein